MNRNVHDAPGEAPELPLAGVLVVALEQAVAAPLCTRKLADAGARVIKVERAEGDFARGYDASVHGGSSYFVWLNRGKESLVLDIKEPADAELLSRIIARADVFIQNLVPGAADRAGFGSATLRARHRRLITCDISGYGESGPYAGMRAYDNLVQAEVGIHAVTGYPGCSREGGNFHLRHRRRDARSCRDPRRPCSRGSARGVAPASRCLSSRRWPTG
jgi:itaconate CoA-transferase